MTFMSPNWAKCGEKFAAVLIVLGSDVRRTRELCVNGNNCNSFALAVPPALSLSFTLSLTAFSVFCQTCTEAAHLVSTRRRVQVETEWKGLLGRWGLLQGTISNHFPLSDASIPPPESLLKPCLGYLFLPVMNGCLSTAVFINKGFNCTMNSRWMSKWGKDRRKTIWTFSILTEWRLHWAKRMKITIILQQLHLILMLMEYHNLNGAFFFIKCILLVILQILQ